MAELQKSTRVAIVGGGIGGLTLANLLQKDGWQDVKVFERWGEVKSRGGHISIMPASLGGALPVLQALGLEEQVSAFAESVPQFKSLVNGQVITDTKLPLGPRVMREALQQVLLNNLKENTVLFGKSLSEFKEFSDHVDLHFEDGTVEAFELVVAADGINSAIADRLFPGAGKQFSGFVSYMCLAKGEYLDEGFYDHHVYGGSQGFSIRAVPGWGFDGRWDLAGFTVRSSNPTSSAWDSECTKEEIRPLLESMEQHAGGCPQWLRKLVDDSERVMKWGIYEHSPKPSWISPGARMVLLGDAAHAMAPYLGKGAQAAMIDAQVLAQELLQRPLPDALAAYELQRKAACEAIAKHAHFEGLGITSCGLAAAYRTTTKGLVAPVHNSMQRHSEKCAEALIRAWELGHHASERLSALLC